ncbi:ATP-dependent RNA helicase HrpA [soil metagenome]
MLDDLTARLAELMLRDEHRLRRRLAAARKARDPEATARLEPELSRAEARITRRRANVPAIGYPEHLPVSQHRDEIATAIRDHQVVILAGETGSGKTTQLPKICLELGRGVRGTIGHTQPRRLAARTVAERIAAELATPLGTVVGWKVRFTDKVGEDTLVKLMTDGILLAEIHHDKALRAYDTLIIDEAHERSLNIDFLLGYLTRLLPRRPDLKVVITSATIDPARFAAHFAGAPVVEVSGRTYPVEVRYRPVVDPDDPDADPDRDQTEAVLDAVDELGAEGRGDILVFLSGEREIRDTADALRARDLRDTEIVPLYARLSAAEQHRVFQPHAVRRIVLATNVAETSLTVPGIRYVVDPGTARISRYSYRTKVQRLPIEAVSQASANQRSGRCGRTSDGICIRLYSEADFEARPEFTDPEILRTNLASIILRMAALDLGDVAAFPFLDPPDRRAVTAGVQLLEELNALDAGRLTPIGRQLAGLPVDPRMARMIVEADRLGCLREVLVVAAVLTIADPRERPADRQQAADQSHARFADPTSDFLGYLNVWRYLREEQRDRSGNQFRRMCKAEFLHYLRVREWQDLVGQLTSITKGLGMTESSTPEDAGRIHTALLAGLLSHIGLRQGRNDYLGARSAKFTVWPGSALAAAPPRWLMAAELVETSRLWGRTLARIDPDAIEALAGHLVHRSYSEPHWDAGRGAVLAAEKVTLYGVPIVVSRQVNYGMIDPAVSRELFIRHALVEGDWQTRHAFFAHNRAALNDVARLEDRARRRDIRIDDETLFELYDRRIGAEVVSARHFDSWWKRTRRSEPDLLSFDTAMLIDAATAGAVDHRDYPDTWDQSGLMLPLSYAFEPGSTVDGVTVHVPLAVVNKLSGDEFSWHVPGLREELVTALMRSLPKDLRRGLGPIADRVTAVLPRLKPGVESLLDALEHELHALTGVRIPREAWDPSRLPDHLRPTFRIVDERDRALAQGKDLAALRERVQPELRRTLSRASGDLERSGLRDWTIDELPRTHEQLIGGHPVTGYPALVDEGDGVAVRVLDSPAVQRRAMWTGVRRLLLLTVASPLRDVVRAMSREAKLALQVNPHGSVPSLLQDCLDCAADEVTTAAGVPPWDRAGFTALQGAAREALLGLTAEIVAATQRVLIAAREVEQRIAAARFAPESALVDIRGQLSGLIYPGFVTSTGRRRLPDLVRYLRAIEHRLDKVATNPRDAVWMSQVEVVQREYDQLRQEVAPDDPGLARIRWMIEELRVSLFAQSLGTREPVSEQRIFRAMDQLTA